ncbi:MAG: L-histidine N(alpha)-methyltransferase [Myxococcota bacterium]
MIHRIAVHPSQYPPSVDARLGQAIRHKRIPSRLLYDSHAQAGRWLQYHDAWSPARTDETVEDLYARLAIKLPEARTLVSMGSGGGQKDLAVLKASSARGYVPVDTSPHLVMTSALRARPLGIDIQPWLVDLEDGLPRLNEEPSAVACFGILPNFEMTWFLEAAGAAVGAGDTLLLSANLAPEPWRGTPSSAIDAIVAQYDNPFGRRWVEGGLRELGLGADRYHMVYRLRSLRADGHAFRIEAVCRLKEDVKIVLPFVEAEWEEGTEWVAFFSNRLSLDLAEAILEEGTGLQVTDREVSRQGLEGVYRLEGSRPKESG